VSGYEREALDRWAARVEFGATAGSAKTPCWRRRDCCAPFDSMNLAARLGHGGLVPFPRKARRAVEAVRDVEELLSSWDRWKFDPAKKRTA